MTKTVILEKIDALTNDKCDSQCVVKLNCNQTWTTMQYRSYEKLSFVYTKIEKRSGKQQRVLYLQFNSNYLGRIKQIASLYAKIYLEESGENDKKSAQGRFYWMGLGAFAAKQVYCGVLAMDDISTKIGSTLGLAGGITTDDLKFFKEEMLKGNLWLFFDIYPSHLYYKANPKGFFDCHHTRDAKHYGDKIKTALAKIPYNEALAEIGYFVPSDFIKEAFRKIKDFEQYGNHKDKIDSLMRIAEHEQIAVLQRCFYASNAQKQQRIKRILDTQKAMEAQPNDAKATFVWKKTKLFLADFLGDVQGRQAVLTNQCWVPWINYMHGVDRVDYNKFYEDMFPNEDLYDVGIKDAQGNYISGRMAFITRIANDYDFIMRRYESKAKGYLSQIANKNIDS